MEESTQPNVPMINVPNSAGTGSRLPFWKIWQLFSPWPPDLKLVHSSESTSIGSPGLLHKASLSLCWGWSGCYWLLGESRTYSWFSSFSPRFDLTERNEFTVSLLTSMCPGRGRLTDIVPRVHIQCLTYSGSAVYVEQMHGSWRGWWLRLQCAVSVLWVFAVSDSTSSLQWFLMSWWCYTCVWFICWKLFTILNIIDFISVCFSWPNLHIKRWETILYYLQCAYDLLKQNRTILFKL